MAALDLITVQNVTDWLNTSNVPFPDGEGSDDDVLQRLVTSVSLFATSYLNRNFQPATYSEVYNGNGRTQLFLRNRPVISVSSLTVDASPMIARTVVGGAGYVNDDTSVYLDAWGGFCRGIQNIAITYRAGLQTADTIAVPASPYTFSLDGLSRPWNGDQGVAYASSGGAAFTKVNVAPTASGTYQVKVNEGVTVYNFAAADTGLNVVLTYGYTPEDLAQALTELACERYKTRNRIGNVSMNIGGGQTVSFSQKDMNENARLIFKQYRNVVPV